MGNSSLLPYVLRMASVSRQSAKCDEVTRSDSLLVMIAVTMFKNSGRLAASRLKYRSRVCSQSSAPPQLASSRASASCPRWKQPSTAAGKFPTTKARFTDSSISIGAGGVACAGAEPAGGAGGGVLSSSSFSASVASATAPSTSSPPKTAAASTPAAGGSSAASAAAAAAVALSSSACTWSALKPSCCSSRSRAESSKMI
mmetsp:Transcript_108726/g.316377  ORF Transcript_108726/g.316377 Transcript_108726/m.316377 type:complete len:200 (-) Transcript_108726:1521-2120(-)